jgi:hypothetical protein
MTFASDGLGAKKPMYTRDMTGKLFAAPELRAGRLAAASCIMLFRNDAYALLLPANHLPGQSFHSG